jgi:hypothetical protein
MRAKPWMTYLSPDGRLFEYLDAELIEEQDDGFKVRVAVAIDAGRVASVDVFVPKTEAT